MHSDPPFTGVGVALVTLFEPHGDVAIEATAHHAARMADAGIEAIVVAGTTGEAFTLTGAERVALIEAIREQVTVPVVAGTGAPSLRQAAELTAEAVDAGAAAVMALSPSGAGDVRPYYDEVGRAAGDTPMLAYHFPAVAPPGVPVAALADLPVVGLKDSEGDAERFLSELTEWDGALYTGSTHLTLLAGALGASGAILAIANLEPELCVAAFAGDADAQKRLVAAHASSRPSPVALKARMAERFGTPETCRVS